jgi:endonuclease-8
MEGTSLVILKEEIKAFKGKKIIAVSGNTKIEKERFKNKTVKDFESWVSISLSALIISLSGYIF